MSSSRQLFVSSPHKKLKKSKKAEKIARQNMLLWFANDHADKCGDLVCEKTNYLMKEFREWLDISEIGFLGPILYIISFFMHRS